MVVDSIGSTDDDDEDGDNGNEEIKTIVNGRGRFCIVGKGQGMEWLW